jgi:hypothetical protein
MRIKPQRQAPLGRASGLEPVPPVHARPTEAVTEKLDAIAVKDEPQIRLTGVIGEPGRDHGGGLWLSIFYLTNESPRSDRRRAVRLDVEVPQDITEKVGDNFKEGEAVTVQGTLTWNGTLAASSLKRLQAQPRRSEGG